MLYHNNSPRWAEVLKLPIPIDRFRGSHLRFEFRHCSSEASPGGGGGGRVLAPRGSTLSRVPAAKDKGEKKLFGFSFTPLMREDGTTLSDDGHELYVYKVTPPTPPQQEQLSECVCVCVQCEENTTFSNHALYLGLPCCKEDLSCPSIPSSLVFQRSPKETFWISTQLSSTKLTQNGSSGPGGAWGGVCGALGLTLVLLLVFSGPAGAAQVEGSPRPGHGHPGEAPPHQRGGDREGQRRRGFTRRRGFARRKGFGRSQFS